MKQNIYYFILTWGIKNILHFFSQAKTLAGQKPLLKKFSKLSVGEVHRKQFRLQIIRNKFKNIQKQNMKSKVNMSS